MFSFKGKSYEIDTYIYVKKYVQILFCYHHNERLIARRRFICSRRWARRRRGSRAEALGLDLVVAAFQVVGVVGLVFAALAVAVVGAVRSAVGVVSAALVEFAPVVNGLGELAVVFPVESRGGDVVLFIPLCVGLD